MRTRNGTRQRGILAALALLLAAAAAEGGQAEPGAVANTGNPVLAPITDDPALPRVLLIGDSISMGYTIGVRARLKGVANVHRIPENGGPTSTGMAKIDAWLGSAKWDVIHFNWGLHDIKYIDGKHQVPIEEYEKNLRALLPRMKATGAALIWCSTTPVPEGKLSPPRTPGDEVAFNACAKKVMDEQGVALNDLYAFCLPRLQELQQKANVHFTPKGSEALAEQVAAAIRRALENRRTGVEHRLARLDAPAQDSPGGKQSFPFGWKGVALAEPERKKALGLDFGGVGTAPQGLAGRLRVTVLVDVRQEHRVDVLLAQSGTRIGTFDIRYASYPQPFEVLLTPEQTQQALAEGVKLQMTVGKTPLWILAETPGAGGQANALLPHLLLAAVSDPRAEFLARMNSLASVHQFGWLEGCVLDGLYDLSQSRPEFKTTVVRHLDLFSNAQGDLIYENHVSERKTNTVQGIEFTLPFAVLAKTMPEHPSVERAVQFWAKAHTPEGLVIDGKTVSTEGCYTVAYPMAAIGRIRNDANLRQNALNQLRLRQKLLVRDGGVHQRGAADGSSVTFKNWARGTAWYMLGLTRTLIELKDAPEDQADLRAELQRVADWALTHQQPGGLWRCFLDDANTGPDTSGSAGIAAALALGHSHGWLKPEHRAAAQKASEGLAAHLTPDGYLGGVAQSNKGGEALQRGEYRVLSQMGMGLYAQLLAALAENGPQK